MKITPETLNRIDAFLADRHWTKGQFAAKRLKMKPSAFSNLRNRILLGQSVQPKTVGMLAHAIGLEPMDICEKQNGNGRRGA